MTTAKEHMHLRMTHIKNIKNSEPKPIDIIHTEEVVIGTKQGTMFPTKIGTTLV